MAGRRVALALSLLAGLVAVDVAAAGTNTILDGNDRPGPLDIRSASQGHAGDRVKHTIRTFANWPKALLGPNTPNLVVLEISTDSDQAPERVVLIFSTPGRMAAGVFTRNGNFLGRADASHPNGHTVGVVIRRSLLGNPAGYRWQAFSIFGSSNRCRSGCVDGAPNGSNQVLHDLRDPTVAFPQPPSPAASTMYNLDFTVGDTGGSGLAFWRLQQRDDGATAWTTVDEQSTTGPQSVLFAADMSGDIDEFRVVAEDRHGNRTVSPIREVTAGR